MIAATLLKLNGWARSFGLIICAFLAFVSLLLLLVNAIKDNHAQGFAQGKVAAQVEAATITNERVEISHEAATQIEAEIASGTGSLLYAQCMRSARTFESCQRFLPDRPKTDH